MNNRALTPRWWLNSNISLLAALHIPQSWIGPSGDTLNPAGTILWVKGRWFCSDTRWFLTLESKEIFKIKDGWQMMAQKWQMIARDKLTAPLSWTIRDVLGARQCLQTGRKEGQQELRWALLHTPSDPSQFSSQQHPGIQQFVQKGQHSGTFTQFPCCRETSIYSHI